MAGFEPTTFVPNEATWASQRQAALAVRKSGCSECWLCWPIEAGANTAADRLRTAYGPGRCTARPGGRHRASSAARRDGGGRRVPAGRPEWPVDHHGAGPPATGRAGRTPTGLPLWSLCRGARGAARGRLAHRRDLAASVQRHQGPCAESVQVIGPLPGQKPPIAPGLARDRPDQAKPGLGDRPFLARYTHTGPAASPHQRSRSRPKPKADKRYDDRSPSTSVRAYGGKLPALGRRHR